MTIIFSSWTPKITFSISEHFHFFCQSTSKGNIFASIFLYDIKNSRSGEVVLVSKFTIVLVIRIKPKAAARSHTPARRPLAHGRDGARSPRAGPQLARARPRRRPLAPRNARHPGLAVTHARPHARPDARSMRRRRRQKLGLGDENGGRLE